MMMFETTIHVPKTEKRCCVFENNHFHFRIYWGISYKCLVSRSVLRYVVHVLIGFRCSQRGPDVTSDYARNNMIETKAPILFQPSPGQSSVITAVLLTSKDCFIRLSQKHKIVLYLQMFQHAKLHISASALFLKYS